MGLSRLATVTSALTLALGCRCSEPVEPAEQSPDAAPARGSALDCTLGQGQFTLAPAESAAAPPADVPQEELDDLDLPFAVELGGAVARDTGFAVAALRGGSRGSTAVVALIAAGASSGRLIDLSAVHGDVAAPRLASDGQRLLAVVPEGDASGQSLRLAAIEGAGSDAHVSWGASVHDGDDESQAFDVAAVPGNGVLVWDEWDKNKNHGVVRVARFATSQLAELAATQALSAPDVDAESPRVVQSANGFWAAWAINDDAPGEKAAPARRTGGASDSDEPTPERTLQALRRGVEVVRLDATGKPLGVARRATPAGAKVTQFDLAAAVGGGALLAYREGAASLASAGGDLVVVLLGADGSERRMPIGEIESGAGVPLLLADGQAPDHVWLALGSPGDESSLWLLHPDAAARPTLLDPRLGQALPVAVRGQQLLWARALGRSLVFSSASCR